MPIYSCPKEMSLTASGTTGEKVACDDDSSDEGVVKNVLLPLYVVTTGCCFIHYSVVTSPPANMCTQESPSVVISVMNVGRSYTNNNTLRNLCLLYRGFYVFAELRYKPRLEKTYYGTYWRLSIQV